MAENPETSDSYGRIVTSKHFERLKAHLDDAKSKHATIEIVAQILMKTLST